MFAITLVILAQAYSSPVPRTMTQNKTPDLAIAVRCVNTAGTAYEACGGTSSGGATGGLTNTELRASAVPVSGSVSVSNLPSSQSVTGTFWQATQPVSGTFWQATQPVSGSVGVTNFPASQAVTGPLTDTQIRATPLPVSGTFWPATQPVSGSVSVSNFPASQAVTGTFFQATQPVSLASAPTTPVTGTFWQATQPVSGTFWQATQPVSGPLTDTQLRASAVPVSGTFFQSTQPVSVAATVAVSGPLTDTQLRASAVPVSGPLTDTQIRATALPVSVAVAGAASSSPVGSVSLGNSLGKALAMKTGTLASSSVTADQVVVTYTVTAGKTLYVSYWDIGARLTTFAATATNFGDCSLESPAGTKLVTEMNAGTGVTLPNAITFPEPIPIAAGVVIRVVCTPAATTAMTWRGNLGGYEK
jgi:hypothetical protein